MANRSLFNCLFETYPWT